jgi:hypothetical protein
MPLFNTVSEENELECQIRKQIKTRCQIGKKILPVSNEEPHFKPVSSKEFSHEISTIILQPEHTNDCADQHNT